jgi:hypothetical protein
MGWLLSDQSVHVAEQAPGIIRKQAHTAELFDVISVSARRSSRVGRWRYKVPGPTPPF